MFRGKICEKGLPNGVAAWAISASQYMQDAVRNVESYLKRKGKVLHKRTNTPLSSNYRLECDVTPELDPSEAFYYPLLIGILRWMVEMG